MTPEQKAAQLQRVEQAEAMLAAFKAELVVGLADRPASDRQRGQVGAASGEWAAQLLDDDVSEFLPTGRLTVEAGGLQPRRSSRSRRPRQGGAASGAVVLARARAIAARHRRLERARCRRR